MQLPCAVAAGVAGPSEGVSPSRADYYVAPHAREALGDNAIPQVLATACAAVASTSVDNGIVQSSRVYHTGADAMERLALRPVFEGEVKSGRSYCLVDDVTNLGGGAGRVG